MPLCYLRSLEEKAREFEISDLQDFFTSNVFLSSGFELPANGAHIIYAA
jgi:hypothetical protein